jgi:hypothetical protein
MKGKNMKTNIRLLTLTLIGALTFCGVSQIRASYDPDTTAFAFVSSTTSLGVDFNGGFSVYSGTAHLWSTATSTGTGGYNIANVNTGATVVVSGTMLDGNIYGDPFGIYLPFSSGTFYAATYNGNSGTNAGGLWRYNNGPWSKQGVFSGLFAAAYGGTTTHLYLSGLNAAWSGTYGQNNVIAVYPGTGTFQPIISATGNSAAVAVDNAGNVYYADYPSSGTAYLRRWAATDVQNAINSGGTIVLSYANASILTALPAGGRASGIAVDSGTNVFLSYNTGTSGGIAVWTGGNSTFDITSPVAVITPTPDGYWDWAGSLFATGDVISGSGTLYAGSTAMLNDLTLITVGANAAKLKAAPQVKAPAKAVIVKQPNAVSNRDAIEQLIKERNKPTQ